MSKSELLKNTLGSDAYWVVNKKIAREVGFTAAVLLADLISKRGYFEKRGELQPDGSFFNFSDAIESDLQIGKEARIAAQKALQARGFLKIYRRGIPPKNFFLIQDDEIIRALNSHTSISTDDHSSTNTTYVPLQTATKNKNKENKNKEKREEEPSSESSSESSSDEHTFSVPLKSSKDIVADILNSFRANYPDWAIKVKTKQPLYNLLFDSFAEEGVSHEFVKSNMDFIKKCLAPKKTHNKDWSDDVKQVLWVALATIDPNKKSMGQQGLGETPDRVSTSNILDPFDYYMSDEYIAKERAIRTAKGENI